jgi:catechol 2,3-dioxygenase-like lactoylglutathione lyase family enzyme
LVLTRIDHVGIACRDLDRAISFYESTFGLAVVSRERHEDQGVTEAMLRVADAPAGTSRGDRGGRRTPDRLEAAARLDGRLDRVPAPKGRRRRTDRTGPSRRNRLILSPRRSRLAARMAAAQAPQAPPEQRLAPALTVMLVRNLRTL